ncbi:TIGR00730 family Rossman fold protein [Corynebacterium sp. HS2168-gen11]|uniref:TIGR00730 family Rossman fold protein n=1 Tax=Corynebacterium sp. HS2168-gen11 TaxID=2974027 RepID=UPI00216AE554|nr:TIGR00730 family Rossman fold protein [Corynebacterium sp. HS2168-gen11]MCS4535525.1 TIGR00730 family Rossman fold protein [Corynebacterium sp. HS2168-gen11]
MSFHVLQPPVEGLRARSMVVEDRHIRGEAVLRNMNRLAPRFTAEDLESEQLREYLSFDAQRGDIGIVLETTDGAVVGAMWVSFIHAWAFIDEDVPEIVISVDPQWQGKGLGGWLIKQAVQYGRTHGWQGMSVHVEPESPARRLYARNEFVAKNASGVMLRTLSPLISAVAVYCGSVTGARPEYAEAARDLGRELARRGISMVYGGGSVGLMGECATACLEAGGEVIGVMPQSLVDLEFAHPGITRLEITKDITERKVRMEELADAFVALPGGIGTLEELSEVLVRQQLGPYTGPVALFNVEGYWNALVDALRLMGEEGFIWERYLDAIILAEDIPELFSGFQSWANPGLKWKKGSRTTSTHH